MMQRMPCQSHRSFLVTFEYPQFFEISQIKESDIAITRGSCTEVAVKRELAIIDTIAMMRQSPQYARSSWIPECHTMIYMET